MKPYAFALLVVASASAFVRAGPIENAMVDAMKLPDAGSYTWITTVDDDARSYTIEGKTERAGDFSLVNMPLVAVVRRRMARGPGANSDNQATAIFKGDEKLVVQDDDTWKTPDELSSSGNSGTAARRPGMSGGGGIGGPRGRGRGGRGPGQDPSAGPAYSNLQLALSRPHEEIAIIVAHSENLKAEEDGVSGTLTETGAELLLVHSGQAQITPLHGSGTFRLWLKNGNLTKYQVKLEGILAINTSGTRREVQVHQSATTNLSYVGATTFDVPAEAKRKLDS